MKRNILKPLTILFDRLLKRQTSGSITCPSCGQLVSVNIKVCPNCGYKNPGLWGFAKPLRSLGSDLGFLSLVIWGCIGLYILTLLVDPTGISSSGTFDLLSPSSTSLLLFGATGAIPVFELGRWWTVLSSAWLHGSLLHIAFNLLWIRELVPIVAQLYGAGRVVIIYTVASITGSLLTSIAGQYFTSLPAILHGANLSIGASGGVFGLFGALVAYGTITGDSHLKQKYWTYAVVFFLLGFVWIGTDNWGHLGGFLGGYTICNLAGLDPRFRESFRHILLALACLGLTLLSILASIIHGILLLPQNW